METLIGFRVIPHTYAPPVGFIGEPHAPLFLSLSIV